MSKRDDLYFIESPALNRIKIGRGNPGHRLAAFLTGSPDPDLRILWQIHGAGDRENETHRAWAAAWSHGEWFHGTPELRTWIRRGSRTEELPQQFQMSGELASCVGYKHDPEHIDGLLGTLEKMTQRD